MSSAPSEECVISSNSHQAPSEHEGQAVNSTVRLTRGETKMTNGPMRATVHPFRSSSCRDSMLHPVAPRRQGPWVPSPRTLGSSGPLPSCALMPPTLFREFLFSVAGPLSLWVASPGVLSQPPASLGRFLGRRPAARSAIAGGRRPLTHSPREGGGQRACTHGGCPPHGFWATRNSGVVIAVGPAAVRQLGRVSSGCQPGVRVVPFIAW